MDSVVVVAMNASGPEMTGVRPETPVFEKGERDVSGPLVWIGATRQARAEECRRRVKEGASQSIFWLLAMEGMNGGYERVGPGDSGKWGPVRSNARSSLHPAILTIKAQHCITWPSVII